MKSLLTRIIVAAGLFILASCTKEMSLEKGNGLVQTNGDFYATIDGNPWNADSIQLAQVNNGGLTISGVSKTGLEISMVLPVFKTGTYNLNASSIPFAFYVNLMGSLTNVYFSNTGTASGTITISSIDTVNHLVSGTFQFSLVNPSDNSIKTITKGVFSYIPYSGGSTGPITQPGGGLDTLEAKVGTNQFNSFQITANTSNGQLAIAGVAADGSAVGLLMPDTITVGSYNFDFGTGNYVGIYYPAGATVGLVSQANGVLKIISNDTVNKRIIGTFSFIATPITSGTPVTITEGYFSVAYH
jgi:hypothetical protein